MKHGMIKTKICNFCCLKYIQQCTNIFSISFARCMFLGIPVTKKYQCFMKTSKPVSLTHSQGLEAQDANASGKTKYNKTNGNQNLQEFREQES